jgi:hypothetical protein
MKQTPPPGSCEQKGCKISHHSIGVNVRSRKPPDANLAAAFRSGPQAAQPSLELMDWLPRATVSR